MTHQEHLRRGHIFIGFDIREVHYEGPFCDLGAVPLYLAWNWRGRRKVVEASMLVAGRKDQLQGVMERWLDPPQPTPREPGVLGFIPRRYDLPTDSYV